MFRNNVVPFHYRHLPACGACSDYTIRTKMQSRTQGLQTRKTLSISIRYEYVSYFKSNRIVIILLGGFDRLRHLRARYACSTHGIRLTLAARSKLTARLPVLAATTAFELASSPCTSPLFRPPPPPPSSASTIKRRSVVVNCLLVVVRFVFDTRKKGKRRRELIVKDTGSRIKHVQTSEFFFVDDGRETETEAEDGIVAQERLHIVGWPKRNTRHEHNHTWYSFSPYTGPIPLRPTKTNI